MKDGKICCSNGVKVAETILCEDLMNIAIKIDFWVYMVLCQNTFFIWQNELVERPTCNLALVVAATDSIVTFNDFPVAINWVRSLSTSVVNDALPHL